MTTDPPQQPTSQHEPTNTLALLLPHPTLFAPPVLDLLRAHYAHFGRIVHWAPVKGFGRVIVVFGSEEEAENAKRQGDWLKLDVPVGGEEKVDGEEKSKEAELVLRLLYLPPSTLNPDPATTHLAPPPLPHNFLISPPGSPPEGWEPAVEEAPNRTILPEDLQRALETLELNSGNRADDGKVIVLDEGGVRVQVEDTTKQERYGGEDCDMEERLESGTGAWNLPSQSSQSGSMGTPGYGVRIIPTAMPPL
ncbi:calcineurin-binding protein [Cryptococcus deuterogattii MMRL2647]|nr:calcineurin-binding protein [Cryptococcus deuterogattii MMRL2647]